MIEEGIVASIAGRDWGLRPVPSLRVTYNPKDESSVAFVFRVLFWLIIRGGF